MHLRILALALVLVSCNSAGLARPGAKNGKAQAPPTPPTQAAAPPASDPTQAQREQEAREVQAEVDANNALEDADKKAFVGAGWTLVNGIAPADDALVTYAPALLSEREAELRAQLASTTPKVGDIANLLAIIHQTHSDDVRFTAIDALGRIDDDQAGAALYALLTDGTLPSDASLRGMVASLLRPDNLDADLAAQMVSALDRGDLSARVRAQIATNLAMLSLRDGVAVRGLSPAGAALVDQARMLLTGTAH